MKNIYTKIALDESNTFWRLKALSVFTIFFAHLPYNGESRLLIYLFNYLGIVGVPIFLMLSGYLGFTSRRSLKSQFVGLLVPLLIWGTLSYIPIVIFSSMSFSEVLIGYFKSIYGCGSWLYFVPVLIWCKLMSSSNRVWIDSILMVTSVTSILLTSLGIINYNDYFTQYTNPFNFLLYYYLGLYVRKYALNYRTAPLLGVSIVLMVGVVFCWKTIPSYFSIWCVPFSICAFILMYHLSRMIRFGESIGKSSYVIYLVHMVPMGVIARRIPFGWDTPLQVVNVIVVFAIIASAVYVLKVVLEKFHQDKTLRYLGYR